MRHVSQATEGATAEQTQRAKNTRRTGLILVGIVVGMFAFGFALVPLYQVFCNITGFNGSFQGRQADSEFVDRIDTGRTITVQFDSTINAGLPWDFEPLAKQMKVHPGEIYEVSYVAKNNADHGIVGQAVPGITPWQATQHFNKLECFCFSNQTLEAGESREMPLRFALSHDLPADIDTLTLSYTFMNTNREPSRRSGDSFQIYPKTAGLQASNNSAPGTMINTSTGGSIR